MKLASLAMAAILAAGAVTAAEANKGQFSPPNTDAQFVGAMSIAWAGGGNGQCPIAGSMHVNTVDGTISSFSTTCPGVTFTHLPWTVVPHGAGKATVKGMTWTAPGMTCGPVDAHVLTSGGQDGWGFEEYFRSNSGYYCTIFGGVPTVPSVVVVPTP